MEKEVYRQSMVALPDQLIANLNPRERNGTEVGADNSTQSTVRESRYPYIQETKMSHRPEIIVDPIEARLEIDMTRTEARPDTIKIGTKVRPEIIEIRIEVRLADTRTEVLPEIIPEPRRGPVL